MDADLHAASSAHPELRAIALFEAAKGVVAWLGAGALELIGPTSLQHGLAALVARLRLNPDHGAQAWLERAINPGSVHLVAAVIAAYGLMRLIEAWGLWRAQAWASWLGCVSAAIYLPFEILALIRHPGWLEITILLVNSLIVAVLARDLIRRHR